MRPPDQRSLFQVEHPRPGHGRRPYDLGQGPEDSGQFVQAVLLEPEGLGLIYWDTEDLHRLLHGPDRDREARRLFTPAADLGDLVRVQLLPYAAELLERLLRPGRRVDWAP